MDGLKQKYGDQIEFVLYDFNDPSLDAARARYSITDRSQYVLVDAQDNIIYRWYGFLSAREVEQKLDEYLSGL